MAKTIIGLFANVSEAQSFIHNLMEAEFTGAHIGLIAVAKDIEGELAKDNASIQVPKADAYRADVSSGSGTAAVVGNLPAALAKRRGETLVSVIADDPMVDHTVTLMERHRAVAIRRRTAERQQSSATRFEPTPALDRSGGTASDEVTCFPPHWAWARGKSRCQF